MLGSFANIAALALKSEYRAIRRRVIRQVVLLSLGSVLGLLALVFLSASVALALVPRIGDWQAFLAVGAGQFVLALAAVLLMRAGRRNRKPAGGADGTGKSTGKSTDDAGALVLSALIAGIALGQGKSG